MRNPLTAITGHVELLLERDDLPDFRRHASLQERQDLAVQFLRFEAEHATGVPVKDKDPEEYVRSGGSPEGD